MNSDPGSTRKVPGVWRSAFIRR